MRNHLAVAALLLAVVMPVNAQDSASTTGSSRGCAEGHRLPRCRTFGVWELASDWRLTGADVATGGFATVRIGVLSNISFARAVGAEAIGGAALDGRGGTRFGAGLRGRQWIAERRAVDLTLGIVSTKIGIREGDDIPEKRVTAPSISLSHNWNDRLALSLSGDVLRVPERGTTVAAYAGARLGSELGLASSLLVSALLLAMGIAFAM